MKRAEQRAELRGEFNEEWRDDNRKKLTITRLLEDAALAMMGQTITQGHSQEQETIVDLSQCPAGVYLISAIQDGKRFVQKLVLNQL